MGTINIIYNKNIIKINNKTRINSLLSYFEPYWLLGEAHNLASVDPSLKSLCSNVCSIYHLASQIYLVSPFHVGAIFLYSVNTHRRVWWNRRCEQGPLVSFWMGQMHIIALGPRICGLTCSLLDIPKFNIQRSSDEVTAGLIEKLNFYRCNNILVSSEAFGLDQFYFLIFYTK